MEALDTILETRDRILEYEENAQGIPTKPVVDLTVNMGPQHPSTHGVLRLVLDLQGENIVNTTVHIGYLHRGTEKLAEHHLYNQVVPYTDRMDYTGAILNNLGYVQCVEKLLGIEVPPRAQYIRTIYAELQRIAAHLVWLGTHAIDIGAMSPFLYSFRERELILNIFEATAGQRLTVSLLRVGGLLHDVPDGILEDIGSFCKLFAGRLEETDRILTKNGMWIARTKDVGVISAEEAINWSLSGPTLRGSGVAYDVRKARPYAAYPYVDFEIPTGTGRGDIYSRYLVRMEEMRQSRRIVEQCLRDLPGGPVTADAPNVIPPPQDLVEKHLESMIFHFIIEIHGFRVPKGEAYSAVEGAKGELGYYIVSDGGGRPYRMHVRAPSFINLQALPEMVRGHLIADVVAAIGSIDIVLGEVDR